MSQQPALLFMITRLIGVSCIHCVLQPSPETPPTAMMLQRVLKAPDHLMLLQISVYCFAFPK